MSSEFDPPESGDPWARYFPDADASWDLHRVVHLHRRAGFAATWDEIGRDLKDGPEPSIDRLLSGKARARGVPDGVTAFACCAAACWTHTRPLTASKPSPEPAAMHLIPSPELARRLKVTARLIKAGVGDARLCALQEPLPLFHRGLQVSGPRFASLGWI